MHDHNSDMAHGFKMSIAKVNKIIMDNEATEEQRNEAIIKLRKLTAQAKTIHDSDADLSPNGIVPYLTMPDLTGIPVGDIPDAVSHITDPKYLRGGRDTGLIVDQTFIAGESYPSGGWTSIPVNKDVVVDSNNPTKVDYTLVDGVPAKMRFPIEDHGDGTYKVACFPSEVDPETGTYDDIINETAKLVDGLNGIGKYRNDGNENYSQADIDLYIGFLEEMRTLNGGL